MKTKIRKKNILHGGKRTGAGRAKRLTAVVKNVLIEKSSVDFLTHYGDGYLGRGIDKAADFLSNLQAVKNEK